MLSSRTCNDRASAVPADLPIARASSRRSAASCEACLQLREVPVRAGSREHLALRRPGGDGLEARRPSRAASQKDR